VRFREVPLIRSLSLGFWLEFNLRCLVCALRFFGTATWPWFLYLGMCGTGARSVDDGSRYDRTEEIVMVSGGSFSSVSILSLVVYFGQLG
jgi:hypothetical protein